jgi:hypothetical protein
LDNIGIFDRWKLASPLSVAWILLRSRAGKDGFESRNCIVSAMNGTFCNSSRVLGHLGRLRSLVGRVVRGVRRGVCGLCAGFRLLSRMVYLV